MRWTPLIALGIGLAEVFAFIAVATWIGFGWAVLAGLALTAFGGFLLKREGVRGWRRLRDAARQGTPAGGEAVDGLVGLGAALLLFVPGFLTGFVGLVLLTPPIRRLASRRVRAATERRVSSRTAGDLFGPRQVRVQKPPKTSTTSPEAEVVEGEIVE